MALNLECPHCKHDGLENNPHQMTEKFNPDADESLVCISMQHFICGRCKIESPLFVYVRHGDVISHMRDEAGNEFFPDGVRHWKRADDNMWLGDGTENKITGLHSILKDGE